MNIYPRKSTYSNTIGLDTMWPISNKEITFAWSSIGSFKYPTSADWSIKSHRGWRRKYPAIIFFAVKCQETNTQHCGVALESIYEKVVQYIPPIESKTFAVSHAFTDKQKINVVM